jgi:hypothetical protein
MKLPEPGESVTIWSDRDGCMQTRLRLECVTVYGGVRGYILHGETCEDLEDDDGEEIEDWYAGGITSAAIVGSYMNLLLALRSVANMNLVSMLRMTVKGQARFPRREPVEIAYDYEAEWSVTLRPKDYLADGSVLFGIEFSRPLTAEELVALCGNFAKAIDNYDEEYNL